MNIVQPLLDLQEIDGRIRELQQEIKDIPKRKAQESISLTSAQGELDTAKVALREAQTRVTASEAEIKAMQDRILQLKKDQATLKTNAEYKEFNLEITKLTNDVEKQEARQMIAMDDLIPLKTRVTEAEAKLLKEKGMIDGYTAELDERFAQVKEELEKTEAERRAFVLTVPANFIAYYERLRTKRWPVVVELLDEGACNGCHLVQPPSVGQMVRRNQNIVTCQMCGRILYSAE